MIGRVLWLFSLLIIIDLVLLLGIRRLAVLSVGDRTRKWLSLAHFAIAGGFLVFSILFFLLQGDPMLDPGVFRSYFIWSDTFLLVYMTKSILAVFILLNALINLIFRKHKKLITTIFMALGCTLALSILILLADGIINGVYRFKLREVEVISDRLPASFDGFRIVQLSDVHLGSFKNEADVKAGLSLIASAHPDLLLITGDLINVNYKEAHPYLPLFKQLQAPYGKYAILGNHDIGDYTRLNKIDALGYNSKGLTTFYHDAGWNLMRNEHIFLHKGLDSIALLGVDNWSMSKFRKLGRLDLANKGVDAQTFSILMSHDPSHWRAEVTENTRIDLMLAGHTHGMQMGINDYGIKWSPISWKYPEWLGLYSEGQQFLYVNAGFGFLGFSGRIGIWPEVTVLVLRKK